MSAPARARAQQRRSTAVPRHHRRVSGPMRPVSAGVAVPGRVGTGSSRQRTSAFERLSKLPEHRIVDSLLRSRGWIVVIAVMLGGIVAMQVSLLKLNAGISRAVQASSTLERQNADMQDTIARLSSGERVRTAAVQSGMVAPPVGEVSFLTSRADRDAALAAHRMQPPSAEAKALMANGGHDPNAAAATTATATATTATATTATAPAAAVTPAPTPVATPTPAAATATSAVPQG
jgi:hypothetical protein